MDMSALSRKSTQLTFLGGGSEKEIISGSHKLEKKYVSKKT
jgi:hypothetical protein